MPVADPEPIMITVEYGITRGDLGLRTPFLFATPRPTPYYYLFLALALGAVLAARQLIDSRIGAYMRAIRDDRGPPGEGEGDDDGGGSDEGAGSGPDGDAPGSADGRDPAADA